MAGGSTLDKWIAWDGSTERTTFPLVMFPNPLAFGSKWVKVKVRRGTWLHFPPLEHQWSVINAVIRTSDNKTFSNQFHWNRNFCLSLKDTWCNRGRVSTLWFHKWFPPDWEKRDWKRFPSETCQIFRFNQQLFAFHINQTFTAMLKGPHFAFETNILYFQKNILDFQTNLFDFQTNLFDFQTKLFQTDCIYNMHFSPPLASSVPAPPDNKKLMFSFFVNNRLLFSISNQ